VSVDLITDHPRTAAGARPKLAAEVGLPPALVAAVAAIGVPPEAVLLAAFGVLLYKYTGQDELVIGLTGDRAVRLPVDPSQPFAALLTHADDALAHGALADPEPAPSPCTVRFVDAVPFGDDVTSSHLEWGNSTSSPPVGLEVALGVRAGGGGAWVVVDGGLFDRGTGERMAAHLRRILEQVTARPALAAGAVDLVTDQERALILGQFNATARPYPRDATIHGLFSEQARRAPDAVAVTCGRQRLTYREMEERSDRLAGRLRAAGVRVGEPVGLLVPRSPQTVLASLAVLKAGGAYLPIDQDCPPERAAYLLADSGARVLVTASDEDGVPGADLRGEWTISPIEAGKWSIHPMKGAAGAASTRPAYVIYTSGTTGRPKGVQVSHRSVVRLVRNTDYLRLSAGTRVLATCAPVFDVATFELWGPLLNGGSLHLVPNDVILSAAALGRAVVEQGITTMWLTSPLFNQLVEQDPTIFRPLRELLVGGDVLSPRHVGKVLAACPAVTLINGYGPTENTTFSTTHVVTGDDLERIPIGRPIANSTAYVIDRDGLLCPIGVPGELCLGGDGLASGYLGRPELTAAAFVPNPFAGGAPMYRSGDVARWRPDGVLEFFGRRDHQVKVRGFRIELGEIEHTMLEHLSVREAVVVAGPAPDRAGAGDRRLRGYYVADPGLPVHELRAHLRRVLPEHMVPSHLVELPAMPLNRSGKVDRGRLPEPPDARTGSEAGTEAGEQVAARDDVERTLVRLAERALGVRDLSVRQDLRDLGADSLTATLIAAGSEAALGSALPVSRILREATVERIAGWLRESGERAAPAIPAAPELDSYPLTPQQQRLYVEQCKDETAVHYNVPVTVELPASTDVGRLLAALQRLTERHDALRTEFVFDGAQVRQRVLPAVPAPVRVVEHELVAARFVRPFDLGHAPLWRAAVHRSAQRVRLLLDLHHIVTDGVSLAVLLDELGALYAGESLPPAGPRYRDYAHWAGGAERVRLRASHGEHWAGVFAGAAPATDLPLDFPRPAIRALDGGAVQFDLGRERATALRGLARRHDVTLFAVLAAAYCALLARLTGSPEVTVGTPVSGRTAPGLDRAVGMFANTVCLRAVAGPGLAFDEFLRDVARTAQDAVAHQEYPLQDLVAMVAPRRDYGRTPLFDSLIALHSARYLRAEFAGRTVPLRLEWNGKAVFDLNLQVYETAGSLTASWQYASLLLRRDTVHGWRDALIDLIDTVLRDPHTRVGELLPHGTGATRTPVPDLEFDLEFDL